MAEVIDSIQNARKTERGISMENDQNSEFFNLCLYTPSRKKRMKIHAPLGSVPEVSILHVLGGPLLALLYYLYFQFNLGAMRSLFVTSWLYHYGDCC